MQLNIKFYAILYPCHIQTGRQTFDKNSQIVLRTFQNMQMHLKSEVENFHDSRVFYLNICTRLTSMMWPSQNFLLHNGTVIKIKGNERIYS